MKRFLQFNEMITPTIIKILFYFGLFITVLSGIIEIIGGAASPFGGGMMVLSGVLTILFGPLLVRVYCELLIVIFKIYENLRAIREKQES